MVCPGDVFIWREDSPHSLAFVIGVRDVSDLDDQKWIIDYVYVSGHESSGFRMSVTYDVITNPTEWLNTDSEWIKV
jgi:hypothetical protein